MEHVQKQRAQFRPNVSHIRPPYSAKCGETQQHESFDCLYTFQGAVTHRHGVAANRYCTLSYAIVIKIAPHLFDFGALTAMTLRHALEILRVPFLLAGPWGL